MKEFRKLKKGFISSGKRYFRLLHRIVLVFLLFSPAMFFCSCGDNALFDAGKTTTREIIINHPISAYNAHSIFDITVVQDTINKIEVTCGENLQKYVNIYSEGDSVFLEQHTKENWSREYEKIKLELHTKQSFWINIWAPVNLTTKGIVSIPDFVVLDWGVFSEVDVNLDVNNCTLVNSPEHFGVIKAKGKSGYTYLWNRGSCKFNTDSLESQTCYVKQKGWSDMYVKATENLTVSLEYTGNVFYSGNPANVTIEQQLSSGKLIKMDHVSK